VVMKNAMSGAVIAAAVASLFASGAWAAEGKSDKSGDQGVHCAGINSCKGTGACAGPNNSCKGQNGCKGQGWSATKTEKECTDKGGKVLAKK